MTTIEPGITREVGGEHTSLDCSQYGRQERLPMERLRDFRATFSIGLSARVGEGVPRRQAARPSRFAVASLREKLEQRPVTSSGASTRCCAAHLRH
jgi:hypothetical protein